MNGRRRAVGWLLVAIAIGIAPARIALSQCMVCTPDMLCGGAPAGGYWCRGNGFACAVAIPCSTPPGGGGCGFGAQQIALQTTLVSIEESRSGPHPARESWTAQGGGRDRSCRSVMGTLASLGLARRGALRLEEGSWLFAGASGAMAFQTATGSGYSMKIICGGAVPSLSIGSVADGREARVVARGEIGKDELVVARIEIDGRPYLLAVRSEWLDVRAPGHAAKVRALQEDLRNELAASVPARVLDMRMTPLRP